MNILNRLYDSVRIECNEMKTQIGPDTEKARHFPLAFKMSDLIVERQVRKPVTVVGEKDIFTVEILLDRFKTFSEIRGHAGIRESDVPIVNVAIEQLEFFAPSGQNEIVGNAFVVIQEVVLDNIRAMTQAKNEIFMTVMSIVLHDVPEYWTRADVHHRLGN